MLEGDPEGAPPVDRVVVAAGRLGQVAPGLGQDRPGGGQAVPVAGGRGVGPLQEALGEPGLAGRPADAGHDGQGVGPVAGRAVAGGVLQLLDQPERRPGVAVGLLDEGGDGQGVGDDLGIADVAAAGQEPGLERGRLLDLAPAGQDVGLAGGEADALVGLGQVPVPLQELVGELEGLVPPAEVEQALQHRHRQPVRHLTDAPLPAELQPGPHRPHAGGRALQLEQLGAEVAVGERGPLPRPSRRPRSTDSRTSSRPPRSPSSSRAQPRYCRARCRMSSAPTRQARSMARCGQSSASAGRPDVHTSLPISR